MKSIGTCSLCLQIGPLSFEHVPPRRVFNCNPAVAHTIYGLTQGNKFKKSPLLLPGPRGLGRYAFCESCNGKTGAWYGNAFADWTGQCLRYADKIRDTSAIILPFNIQPLNVLKQIATMVVAVSGSTKHSPQFDHLRRFILSPNSMDFPTEMVFRTYFNPLDPNRKNQPLLTQNRLSESCAVLDTRTGTSVLVIGEIAFPPMGYVAYSSAEGKPVSTDFQTLCDIRSFTNHRYSKEAAVFMRLPVRYPFGPVPGYYPNLNRPEERQFIDDHHVLLTTK